MFDLVEPVLWAFVQNFHLDKSNAAVHCAPVKFSPLTFRLVQALLVLWPEDEDITPEMAEVRAAIGAYVLDGGR